MDRRQFLATCAGGLVALSGCFGASSRSLPDPPAGSWRQYASDAGNSGFADVAVPSRGNPAWDDGEANVAEPLVADGIVYSVADDASALDAQTGEREWRVDLPGRADHAPALVGDRLLVATDQRVVALSREDGAERTAIDVPRPTEGAVTVTADPPVATIPLAAERGEPGLVALDPETLDRLWDDPLLGARTTASGDGRVYATGYQQDGDTAVLRGLSAADGAQLWERELDGIDASPVVADEGVVVADSGSLAVHDPEDGQRLRSLGRFGERIETPPAVADGTAYVASGEGRLAAVSLADGSTTWRVDSRVTADTGISVGHEAVVASVTDLPESSLAGLAAFDRADGAVRWEHQIEGFDAYASTAPVLADGAVFYTSNESLGVVALGDLPPRDEE